MHLNPLRALSLTRFASSTFNVEAESAGLVPANFSLTRLSKELAN
jgi:hypothetical protein